MHLVGGFNHFFLNCLCSLEKFYGGQLERKFRFQDFLRLEQELRAELDNRSLSDPVKLLQEQAVHNLRITVTVTCHKAWKTLNCPSIQCTLANCKKMHFTLSKEAVFFVLNLFDALYLTLQLCMFGLMLYFLLSHLIDCEVFDSLICLSIPDLIWKCQST